MRFSRCTPQAALFTLPAGHLADRAGREFHPRELSRMSNGATQMSLSSESLKTYLAERFGADTDGIDDTTPLFSSNLLDSFSMVDLIMFIEQGAGIRMDAWDVTLDNLDSIGQILAYAESRKA
jgi:acyl carrier protein